MNSRSRHLRRLTSKELTDLSDKGPFNRDYVELSEGYLQNGGVVTLAAAIATDIEGGKSRGNQARGPEDLEAKRRDDSKASHYEDGGT